MKLNLSYTHPDEKKHPKERRAESISFLNQAENSRVNLHSNINSGRYSNTTFGTAKREVFLKPELKVPYYLPLIPSDKTHGKFSKAPRPLNINVSGRDSPNPARYSINDSNVHPAESSFSFGQSYRAYSKVVVPGQAKQDILSANPGPGRYDFAKPLGQGMSKYSFALSNPPPTKYQPEKFQPSQKFSKKSIGLAKRQFTYIPEKSEIPGPGSYSPIMMDFIKTPGTTPKHETPSRRSQSVRNKIPREKLLLPGPGAYDLTSSYKIRDWEEQKLKAAKYRVLRRGRISNTSFITENTQLL